MEGGGDKLEPYSTFLHNVITFRTYNALPVTLNFGEDITTVTTKRHSTNRPIDQAHEQNNEIV